MAKRKMTVEKVLEICVEIQTTHKGLHTLCKERNSSAPAFYDLIDKDKQAIYGPEENEKLSDIYTRAKDRQADYLADLINEVSFDDGDDEKKFVGINHIQRDRLKVDSLKFIAAKLKPKKYGDKVEHEHKVEVHEISFKKKDKGNSSKG